MSSASGQSAAKPGEPPRPIQWRSWPLRDNLATAAAVAVGASGVAAGVYWVTAQLHLASLAALVLLVSLWRCLVPIQFELNVHGVHQWVFGRYRRIPWREVRSYRVCSSGVLLLPTEAPCPIDSARGLFVPWGNRREEVLAHVRYFLHGPPADG